MTKYPPIRLLAGQVAGALVALSLAACGGGGGGDSSSGSSGSGSTSGSGTGTATPSGGSTSTPTVLAAADSATVAAGGSTTLLANDTIGGAPASAGSGGNVVFALVGTAPTGITVSDGVLAVGAEAAAGSFSLDYRICQPTSTGAASSNCATATARITVPPPVLSASADSFNLLPGGSADVLANDRLGAAVASATTVSTSASGSLPSGLSLSAGGVLSAASTLAGGTYTVNYTACQIAVPSNCASAQATVVVPSTGTLSGRAVDGSTGLGVAGVSVSAGGLRTTTDSSGNFSFSSMPAASRLPVQFSGSGYAEMGRIAALGAGASADVQVRLTRIAGSATVDASAGGIASLSGSTAQVTLPPAGLQRADGTVATGTVTVAMTPITVGTDSTLMPGDFQTLVSGTLQPIESFGALNVQLSDASGASLNLRSGQTAKMRIPVSSRTASASLPSTVPLFYFDTSTGNWVQEGAAALKTSGTEYYYEGTVSHFSTWNADQVYNTVRVTGCVADVNGNRISGARVTSDGVDYSGTSSASTDAAGNFTIAIRKASVATLTGLAGSRLTNTLSVGAYSVDTTLTGCLTLGSGTGSVTMKLTWGATPSDLDSHLYTPSGSHVYYSSKGSLSAAPYANLDVDDTSSYGPEVVTVNRLMVGTYRYLVHNYSGQGSARIGASGARVELNLPGRTVELFVPPTTGETASTNWWSLFELTVDAACNVTLNRVNSFLTAAPTVSTATATYCTAPAN